MHIYTPYALQMKLEKILIFSYAMKTTSMSKYIRFILLKGFTTETRR